MLGEHFGEDPCMFQHNSGPIHKAKYMKGSFSQFGGEELDWPQLSNMFGLKPNMDWEPCVQAPKA